MAAPQASVTGHRSGSTAYRPDIDGLRALAVAAVITYHTGVAHAGGGYVGVDVFFVISGYLIGSILYREVAEGRFSLLGFYERRIRRIQPALVVMVLASAVLFWELLTPVDFKRFG